MNEFLTGTRTRRISLRTLLTFSTEHKTVVVTTTSTLLEATPFRFSPEETMNFSKLISGNCTHVNLKYENS